MLAQLQLVLMTAQATGGHICKYGINLVRNFPFVGLPYIILFAFFRRVLNIVRKVKLSKGVAIWHGFEKKCYLAHISFAFSSEQKGIRTAINLGSKHTNL